MKNYPVYLILFLSIILTGCLGSNNDDDIIISFEPIEVKFTQDLITGCNQVATVNGVKLNYIAYTENESFVPSFIGTCLWDSNLDVEGREEHIYFGFVNLAFFGGVLEIDFSDLDGASKISIAIEDNCMAGCTQANLYEGNTIVANTANITHNPQTENLVFDNLTPNATKVRVWTGEALLYKITIE